MPRTKLRKNQMMRHRSITLQQWWRNSKTRTSGTEKLVVPLAQPVTALLKAHYLTGYFGACRLVEENALDLHIGGYADDDAEYAQRRLQRVARALQFMEISGLRPSRSNRCYLRSDWYNRPPIAGKAEPADNAPRDRLTMIREMV